MAFCLFAVLKDNTAALTYTIAQSHTTNAFDIKRHVVVIDIDLS